MPKGRWQQVYAIQAGDAIKVGISDDPERRMADLQIANPVELKLLWTCGPISPSKALEWEQKVHALFQSQALHGEWFRYSDELATLADSDFFPFKRKGKATSIADKHEMELVLTPSVEALLSDKRMAYRLVEVARVLGIEKREVETLTRLGVLHHVQFGGEVRIPRKALDAALVWRQLWVDGFI